MIKPHKLVYDAVWRKWFDFRHRGFLKKLFQLGAVKPLGIEIIQTASLDEKTKMCTGEIINRWRYDGNGLKIVPLNSDAGEQKFDYCYYCIDKDKRKFAITWATIFPNQSTRKKTHYIHHGEIYEIVERDGIQDFELISCWME